MSFLAEGTRWAGGLCLTSDRHLIEMSVGVGNIQYYPVFGKTKMVGFSFLIYIFFFQISVKNKFAGGRRHERVTANATCE